MMSIAPACLGGDKKNNKPPPTLPSAPTSLAFSLATSARIDLTWIDTSNNEFEFRIERSDDGGTTYNQVGTAPMNLQGFTDLGLVANKVYWYRVAAWNGKGYSSFVGPISVPTKALLWSLVPAAVTDPAFGRSSHSAVFDAIGGRMIVFGGWDDSTIVTDEVWAFNLSQSIPPQPWSQKTTGGVTAPFRVGHSAVYDSIHRRMIVFGGQDEFLNYSNLVYVLNLDDSSQPMQWSQPVPSGTPPSARAYHTAVYDAVNQRMIVYGGTGGGAFGYDDVHFLNFPTSTSFVWSTPAIGARPIRRSQHAAIYDPLGSNMMIFGGFDQEAIPDGSSLNDETWGFTQSPETWSRLSPGTPGLRMGHSAIYDSASRRMVTWSGATTVSSTLTDEMWALRLDVSPVWSILNPSSGSPPPGRSGHSAIFDSGFNRMVIYGGVDDLFTAFNEVWVVEM
jgi:galactose oxidase-like protein/Kelch motif protein